MSSLRICLLSAALLIGWGAAAQAPGEQTRPTNIRVLGPTEHDLYVRAFEAAAHGDWTGAHALVAQGHDPVARQLLEWRYVLDKDSGATFAEIDAAMKDTRGWPLRGTMQARAEAVLPPEMTAPQVIAWFDGRAPNSSIGKVRLGEALVASGPSSSSMATRGARLIRDGWAEGSFDPPVELAIVQKDGAYLTPESDKMRLDALLWRSEITAARREMSRVDDKIAAVTAARIALDGGLLRARPMLAKVRDSDDPDLLFDWSRALRVGHQDGAAHAMLLRVPAAHMTRDHAQRWWTEVSIQARDALAAHDPRLALRLVVHAGFTTGDLYAEQQFLAGFIALRMLKEPDTALPYFQRLDAAVARPISKARARYWQGRVYEARGDTALAVAQYRLAASYPETFYGQVALTRIDASPVLHLTETPVETAAPGELDGDLLMPQIKTLAELGQESSLRFFIDRDLEANTSPGHLKRLMLSLTDWGYPEIAVRLAKTASYGGTYVLDQLYPVIPLPPYKGPGTGPEPALMLGLLRQETEFDAYAVNPSGARGIGQLMPGTARAMAQLAGLPWRPGDLLSDPSYNIQLGMVEFSGHLSRYGNSPALAMASYNAGPNNAKKWIEANGDPRGAADPIDWIEMIPFGETRNYVQRALENTGVYRARLAGRDVPLKIVSDLYAPGTVPPAVLRSTGN